MSDVSTDAYFEILRRVPVDSLCQMRLVCKSWRDIIDGPQFIKLHLHNGTGNNWIILHRKFKGTSNLFLLPLKHLIYPESSSGRWVYMANTKAPPVTRGVVRMRNDLVYPTCNGLILITASWKNIAWMIWNPFTGQSVKVPLCDDLTDCNYRKFPRGFGYVEATDDYKVVIISGSRTFICSTNLGAWRRVQDFPKVDRNISFKGAFANGALHWIVYSADRNSDLYWIVALDLNKETYRKIPFPPVTDSKSSYIWSLTALGGRLFLSSTSLADQFVVWMIDDYNGSVDKLWSKMMSVKLESTFRGITPAAYLKSENRFLLSYSNTKLAWYDLEKQCLLKVSMEVNPGEHDHLARNYYVDHPEFVLRSGCFQIIPASLVRLWSDETLSGRKRKRRAVKKFGLKVSVDAL